MITPIRARSGGAFMIIFALPFLAVGCGATWWQWRDFLLARKIQASWPEVEARVTRAELETRRGAKSGTTLVARGEFNYTINGVAYHSTRISLSNAADNLGDYQRRLHRAMLEAQQSGQPLTARVNPHNPAEAVLQPEWRADLALFKATFGTLFGLIGTGMFALWLQSWKTRSRLARLRRAYPSEPWRWREDWAAGVLRTDARAHTTGSALVLAGLNTPTLPLWTALKSAWAAGGSFRWILAAALATTAALSFLTIQAGLRARKNHGTRVELPETPLRPGATAHLVFHSSRRLASGTTLTAEIECIQETITGSDRRRKIRRKTLWRTRQRRTESIAPEEPVELRFDLPANLPQTSADPEANPRIVWWLRLRGRGSSPDLTQDHELPVFAPDSTQHS